MYEGDFKDSLKMGRGILYNENGKKEYDGEIKKGLKDGKGTLYDKDENIIIYEGNFKDDNII